MQLKFIDLKSRLLCKVTLKASGLWELGVRSRRLCPGVLCGKPTWTSGAGARSEVLPARPLPTGTVLRHKVPQSENVALHVSPAAPAWAALWSLEKGVEARTSAGSHAPSHREREIVPFFTWAGSRVSREVLRQKEYGQYLQDSAQESWAPAGVVWVAGFFPH